MTTSHLDAAALAAEVTRLADDIADAVNDLANGRNYPDLLSAIRRLAALAQRRESTSECAQRAEVDETVRRDAGRYRTWRALIHGPNIDNANDDPLIAINEANSADELDAACDAARAQLRSDRD
jgi:hypothetical protein